MLRLSAIFCATLCLVIPTLSALALPGDIVMSLPSPGHHTTGLTSDGQALWVADRLSDTLYAVDPLSGAIRKTMPAPGFMPRGLAWDGKSLWCIDGEEKRIVQIDPETGLTLKSLEAPGDNPQGLAWDGHNLWLADDAEDIISQISTDDGTIIESHTAPSGSTTGLAYWKDYLLCADRRDDKIYLMDPHAGEVILALDAPGKYVWGIAAEGDKLWAADYQSDSLYQIVIEDGQTVKRTNLHTLDLTLTHEFRNYGPGRVESLDVFIAIPDSLPNQRLVTTPVFSPAPQETVADRWHQPVAHFQFSNLPLAERKRLTMTVTAELADTRQFIFPHRVGKLSEIPKSVRELYLIDEDKYRMSDPLIAAAVRVAVDDEKNPYWMMRRIHRYVREHLEYELAGGWNVAPKVLERGTGSCSEYTFLFISMCRAAGIPARYVGSVVIRGDEASYDEVFHRWSQVYLPGYGWVHVDPQGGDKEKPADVAESIGVVSNRFLITTAGGGASEYLGWNYNYDQRWTARGPVKVYSEAVGEWSPVTPEAVQKITTSVSGKTCTP